MNEFVTQFFFLGLIVANVFFYTYHLRQYQLIHKRKFSFLNQFPFELFHQPSFDVLIASLLLFLTTLTTFLYFMYQTSSYIEIFNYVHLVVLTLIAMTSFLLFYIKPIRIEIFLFNSTLFLTMVMSFYGWSSFVFVQTSAGQPFPSTVWIASFFFLMMTGIIFNPKLRDWSQLERVGDNEKPLYQRPKLFVLAFTQWFVLFSLIAYAILVQIFSLI